MTSGERPRHVPVLIHEAVHWLNVQQSGTYVDATVGAGGHAEAIVERLGNGLLVGIDRDPSALEVAGITLAGYPNVRLVHGNHGDLDAILDRLEITCIDGVLLDVGMSSMQLDMPERGFSFQVLGPLDMRMDPTQGTPASEWLRYISKDVLIRVLREFGDVRRPHRVAEAILRRRDAGEMETTQDLAQAVFSVCGRGSVGLDEARRTFQALRIAVNDELTQLEKALHAAVHRLRSGGRLVVITFHGGEDRVVKSALREYLRPRYVYTPDGRVEQKQEASLKLLTPKPIRPSESELRANPRAQSARLRAAEKI